MTTGFARREVTETLPLADGKGISSSGVMRMKILGPGGGEMVMMRLAGFSLKWTLLMILGEGVAASAIFRCWGWPSVAGEESPEVFPVVGIYNRRSDSRAIPCHLMESCLPDLLSIGNPGTTPHFSHKSKHNGKVICSIYIAAAKLLLHC